MNVDCDPLEQPDVLCDLGVDHWPFLDDDVDEAVASHVLEHLPGESFYHFLRELWRVSKHGAQTRIVLPHPSHDLFLSDPSHCRPVMPGTMAMFSKRYVDGLAAQGHSLTPFYRRIGVDFDFSNLVYTFDASVGVDDPDLEWKAKHLRNIIREWSMILTAVKR